MQTLENVHSQAFYERSSPEVARDLLGSILCRRLPTGEVIHGRIVETEAYRDNEPACHAFRGPTPRCKVMFGPAGFAYVYFIYGANYCLNVVTEAPGRGCAVLIRGIESENTNGPGKICKRFQINREHNGVNLMDSGSDIWIAQGEPFKKNEIGVSARIGVTSAEDVPWRFFVRNHPCVSGPRALNRDYIVLPKHARKANLLARD